MRRVRAPHLPARRPLPRALLPLAWMLLALGVAGVLATGCGDTADTSRARWVPADAPLLAEVSLDAERLRASLDTLRRVPSLRDVLDEELPADDANGSDDGGSGALQERIVQAAAMAAWPSLELELDGDEDLRPWIGARLGMAALELEPEPDGGGGAGGDDPARVPWIGWLDVADPGEARAFVQRLEDDGAIDDAGFEVDDLPVWSVAGAADDAPLLVLADDALLVGARDALERAIEAHEEGRAIDDDPIVRAMLEDADSSDQVRIVARVDDLVAEGASLARAADALGPELAPLVDALRARQVEMALPDHVGIGIGIDEVGLRADVTWTPSEPAGGEVNAVRLAGKVPANARQVWAGSLTSSARRAADVTNAVTGALGSSGVDPAAALAQCRRVDRPWCRALLGLGGTLDETLSFGAGLPPAAGGVLYLPEPGGEVPLDERVTTRLDRLGIDRSSAPIAAGTVEALATPAVAVLSDTLGPDVEGSIDLEDVEGAVAAASNRANRSLQGARVSSVVEQTDSGDALELRISGTPPPGDTPPPRGGPGNDSQARNRVRTTAPEPVTLVDLTITTGPGETLVIGAPDRAVERMLDALDGSGTLLRDAPRFRRDIDGAGVPEGAGLLGWVDDPEGVARLMADLVRASELTRSDAVDEIAEGAAEQLGGAVTWSEGIGPDERVGALRVVVPIYDDTADEREDADG